MRSCTSSVLNPDGQRREETERKHLIGFSCPLKSAACRSVSTTPLSLGRNYSGSISLSTPLQAIKKPQPLSRGPSANLNIYRTIIAPTTKIPTTTTVLTTAITAGLTAAAATAAATFPRLGGRIDLAEFLSLYAIQIPQSCTKAFERFCALTWEVAHYPPSGASIVIEIAADIGPPRRLKSRLSGAVWSRPARPSTAAILAIYKLRSRRPIISQIERALWSSSISLSTSTVRKTSWERSIDERRGWGNRKVRSRL
jgi:hypothetical protein